MNSRNYLKLLVKLLFCINLPAFIYTQIPLDYEVKEESPKGTLIGNLKQDSNIETKIQENIVFEIYGSEKNEYFRLEHDTGKLFVEKVIDREKILVQEEFKKETVRLEFSVLVSKKVWINVKVMIIDINDHTPVFLKPPETINISEEVKVNYKISLTAAIDKDEHPNNVQNYSISGVGRFFAVEYEFYSLYLVVKKTLDYELKKIHNATIIACDGGTPKKCGSHLIMINIKDVNDNKPTFPKIPYTVSVFENCTKGSVVAKVVAEDKDSGRYGQVRYKLGQMYDMNAVNYFNIKEHIGEVYLKMSLDAKKTPKFTLTIEAIDGGDIPYVGQTTLNINVLDINNHRPKIRIRTLTNSINHITVLENSKPIKHIGLVWASDEDIGENGKVQCMITNRGLGNFLLKHSNTADNQEIYSLMTNATFDRETTDQLPIKIRCNDRGNPSLRAEEDFNVEVIDQNEYEPEFEYRIYNASVPENIKNGSRVIKVKANDKDSTARLVYKLVEDAATYLKIDLETGTITAKGNLDRETTPQIRFSVFAIDSAEPRKFTATALVVVTVLDVNDNVPTLIKNHHFKIMENLPGSVQNHFGVVSAIDLDDGENGTVRFAISRAIDAEGRKLNITCFHIDQIKGSLYAVEMLNREVSDRYRLYIKLMDQGIPSKTSTEVVTVEVLDVNDNAPKWTFPSKYERQVNISGTVRPGESLTTLRAEDIDSPPNANLTYTLVSRHELFTLDYFRGDLRAADILPENSRYEIKIRVSDNGRPAKSADERLFINISPGIGNAISNGRSKGIKLNLSLIIIMAVTTAIICIGLIGAICSLRRRPNFRTSGSQRNESMRKWAEDNNTYTGADGWASPRPGHFGPPPPMSAFLTTDLPPGLTKDSQAMNTSQTLRVRPYPMDFDGSSADSGHCASEDDPLNDSKGREYRPTAYLQPAMRSFPILPEDSVVQCGCHDYNSLMGPPGGHGNDCSRGIIPNEDHSNIPLTTNGVMSPNYTHSLVTPMRTFPRPIRPLGDGLGSIDRSHSKAGIISNSGLNNNGSILRSPNNSRQTNL